MRLTILGCGTSTGVPVPGCTCAVCTSGNPLNNRTRTSALVTGPGGESILIDASPDFRFQALRARISRIDAVLFTHPHADHILGIDDLRVFNFIQKARIPCYGSASTLSTIRSFFTYIFAPDPFYEGGRVAELDLKEFRNGEVIEVAGLKVDTFELKHGRMAVSGFRFGDLAYATDCNFIADESRKIIQNAKTLVLDGLRPEHHSTHFSIDDAIEVSRELNMAETYLTHMTHSVDYNEISTRLPNSVHLAYDGLEIPFLWNSARNN